MQNKTIEFVKEIIDLFVNETKITPGLILDFGTFKTRDTVICGNRSEVDFENGYFWYHYDRFYFVFKQKYNKKY